MNLWTSPYAYVSEQRCDCADDIQALHAGRFLHVRRDGVVRLREDVQREIGTVAAVLEAGVWGQGRRWVFLFDATSDDLVTTEAALRFALYRLGVPAPLTVGTTTAEPGRGIIQFTYKAGAV